MGAVSPCGFVLLRIKTGKTVKFYRIDEARKSNKSGSRKKKQDKKIDLAVCSSFFPIVFGLSRCICNDKGRSVFAAGVDLRHIDVTDGSRVTRITLTESRVNGPLA
jgi:hypothetical protein